MSHSYDGKLVAEGRVFGGRMPGRKDGELCVEVANFEHARWPLRVDSKAGEWIAVTGTDTYVAARSKKALEDHMRAAEIAKRSVSWRRYIVIHYEADSIARYEQAHGRRALPGDKRPDRVRSLSLRWEVEDWSEPFAVVGSTRKRRKHRSVRETYGELHEVSKGTLTNNYGYQTLAESIAEGPDIDGGPRDAYNEQWGTGEELPRGAIPFSREALATLERLVDLLGQVDAAISTLLEGTPEEVLERLLAPGGQLALESGERCPDAGHHGEYDPPCPVCDAR